MTQLEPIDALIDHLARTPPLKDSVNMYAHEGDPDNGIRRENLRRYLTQIGAQGPQTLLVAEAPGYRGARLTGVPFSSPTLIKEGMEGVPVFGEANGYALAPGTEQIARREQTATIVWSVLRSMRPLPLAWNSYPFHPHKPGETWSNRKPRQPELALGRVFLEAVLAMFSIQQVIAVGNTAAETLRVLDIPAEKVRHPAQGGKADFVAGITRLLG
jgi:uracil-DNA glycosylase